jgi:hypothetical protein
MEKSNKKDEKKEEQKQKEDLIKEEISQIIQEFDSKRMGIKLDDYVTIFNSILEKWELKIKNPELLEFLTVNSVKVLELGLKEKSLSTFYDNFSQENKANFMKLLYVLYDRIGQKKDCSGIRSTKLFGIHNKLIEQEGKGGVARSMFSIQK